MLALSQKRTRLVFFSSFLMYSPEKIFRGKSFHGVSKKVSGREALSPTDMFPLTQRAKILMMIEALLSLLVVVVPTVSEFHLPW